MPETPIEQSPRGPYRPSMERRVSRLEQYVREVRATCGRLETMVADVRSAVARIEATLPQLATKAEMAEIAKALGSPSR
jgi:phage shock protein A